MTIKNLVDDGEILALMSMASRAALLAEELEANADEPIFHPILSNDMERIQFIAAGKNTAKILARVDREAPGLVPLPHDNIPWADRVKED